MLPVRSGIGAVLRTAWLTGRNDRIVVRYCFRELQFAEGRAGMEQEHGKNSRSPQCATEMPPTRRNRGSTLTSHRMGEASTM